MPASVSPAPAPVQFHPEPGLEARRAVQSLETDKPFFEKKRTEPAPAAPTEVSFGAFRLLPTQFLLLEGDNPLPIGSRALEILTVLLERPGELISKQELMARVWPNVFVEPANLTVHLSALRRTLRDGRDGNRFIINIPGRGYAFVAALRYRDPGIERDRPALPSGTKALRRRSTIEAMNTARRVTSRGSHDPVRATHHHIVR